MPFLKQSPPVRPKALLALTVAVALIVAVMVGLTARASPVSAVDEVGIFAGDSVSVDPAMVIQDDGITATQPDAAIVTETLGPGDLGSWTLSIAYDNDIVSAIDVTTIADDTTYHGDSVSPIAIIDVGINDEGTSLVIIDQDDGIGATSAAGYDPLGYGNSAGLWIAVGAFALILLTVGTFSITRVLRSTAASTSGSTTARGMREHTSPTAEEGRVTKRPDLPQASTRSVATA